MGLDLPVCRRDGDEPAERNTFEELGYKEDSERLSEKHDKDEGIQQHETDDTGPAISDLGGNRTSHKDTGKSTERHTHLERRLPAGLDDFSVVAVGDTVFVSESRKGNETAHEEDTVRFHLSSVMLLPITHDDGRRHDERPETRPGISLDSLKHSHSVLSVLSFHRVRPHVGCLLDVGHMFDSRLLGVGVWARYFDISRHGEVCLWGMRWGIVDEAAGSYMDALGGSGAAYAPRLTVTPHATSLSSVLNRPTGGQLHAVNAAALRVRSGDRKRFGGEGSYIRGSQLN